MFFSIVYFILFAVATFPLAQQFIPPFLCSFTQAQTADKWKALPAESKNIVIGIVSLLAYPMALSADWLVSYLFLPALLALLMAYGYARENLRASILQLFDEENLVGRGSESRSALYAPSFPEKVKKTQ